MRLVFVASLQLLGNGAAPVITKHLICLVDSTHLHSAFNEFMTSELRAFSLFGRFIVAKAMKPSIVSSATGIFSIVNTAEFGSSMLQSIDHSLDDLSYYG